MKKCIWKVSFKMKTSEYRNVSEGFTALVLMENYGLESYKAAGQSVIDQYGMFEDFELGAIVPGSIPREKVVKVVRPEEDIYGLQ